MPDFDSFTQDDSYGYDDSDLYVEDGDEFDYNPSFTIEDEGDAELAQDQILERQELEDFEQADEYFNHWDSGDYGY